MQLHSLDKNAPKSEPEPKLHGIAWVAVLVLVAIFIIAMAVFGVTPNG